MKKLIEINSRHNVEQRKKKQRSDTLGWLMWSGVPQSNVLISLSISVSFSFTPLSQHRQQYWLVDVQMISTPTPKTMKKSSVLKHSEQKIESERVTQRERERIL